MISRQQLEENWDSICQAVQSRWPILGGEELHEARHSAGHFVGLIQQRTGEQQVEIEHFVESVVSPVQSFLRQTSAELTRSPVAATAAALGAGFVVGIAIASLVSMPEA